MKKESTIKKISAIEAANNMLAALDLTAEDFEKEGNLEASYQIDLARHYLKKAVEEGELNGVEVPEDIFEASENYELVNNDFGIEPMDENPFNEKDLSAASTPVEEEIKAEEEEPLKAFDYEKIAYKGDIRSRMANLAKK